MKNKYLISNDFYILDGLYSYLIYFDYFLSPGFPLTKYIRNSNLRKLVYLFIRAGVISLYISQLYKLRYQVVEVNEDALIIFKGPGKWGSIIKLIKKDGKLAITKKVHNKNIYSKEKRFYEKYKHNNSKLKLPKHTFIENNTIEIEFLESKTFQKLIMDGSLTFEQSVDHYKKIKNEIKLFYGNKKTLIHGDLWPGNIFPINNLYYLIDFGDSHKSNYRYDLYVLLCSIVSKYYNAKDNDPILTHYLDLDIMFTKLLDTNMQQLKIIEEQFLSYRKKRFPSLYYKTKNSVNIYNLFVRYFRMKLFINRAGLLKISFPKKGI